MPRYTNVIHPFPTNPPIVPDETNECGVYRMKLKIKKTQSKSFIVFEGVRSAMYLYVNGKEVGYHQDSMTPAEW